VAFVRSAGGWQKILLARKFGDYLKSDERILGDSDSVEEVLDAAQEKMETVSLYRPKGLDLDWVAQMAADLLQTDLAELWKGGKKSTTVQVRSLVCYWATQELGMTATAVGKRLKITQSAACRAAQRGEQLAADVTGELKV